MLASDGCRYERRGSQVFLPKTGLALRLTSVDVSRSGFYAWLRKPLSDRAREDQRLLGLIVAAYTARVGVDGAQRIFLDLREAGEIGSERRVARIMLKQCLGARIAAQFTVHLAQLAHRSLGKPHLQLGAERMLSCPRELSFSTCANSSCPRELFACPCDHSSCPLLLSSDSPIKPLRLIQAFHRASIISIFGRWLKLPYTALLLLSSLQANREMTSTCALAPRCSEASDIGVREIGRRTLW